MAKIDQDHSRFKKIIRGTIKQNLKKLMTNNELIGRVGKKLVSIPIPRIELPRFKHDFRKTGGVSQGDGDIGTVRGPGEMPRSPRTGW